MGFLLEWEVKEKPRTTSTAKSWRGLQASYIQHTSSSGSTEYPSCDFSTFLYRFASKIDVLQTKYGWYKNIFYLYVHSVFIEPRMCLKFCVDISDTTDTSMYLMYPPDCPAVLADNTSRFPWIWRSSRPPWQHLGALRVVAVCLTFKSGQNQPWGRVFSQDIKMIKPIIYPLGNKLLSSMYKFHGSSDITYKNILRAQITARHW